MNYIFLAFIAASCFALSQVITKLLSKHSIDNKDSMMAYFMLTTFSFAFFLIPFVPLSLPSFEVLKLIFISNTAFLVGYYFFFTGIYDADASSFAPLFQLQAGLIGVLAFLFLGERFPAHSYFWLAILILGAVLVSLDEDMTPKSFLKKGILFIILMQIFHAVSNLFVGITLKSTTPVQFLFWENLMIGAICIVFILLRRPKMNYKFKTVVAPMIVSSYIVGIGVVALFEAFKQNLTISSVVGLLSAPIVFVISIIASRFSPKFLEHHTTKVYLIRGIGMLIILLGVYKITTG